MKLRIAGGLILGAVMLTAGALIPRGTGATDTAYEAATIDAAGVISPPGNPSAVSIDALEARIENDPEDAKSHAQLALAHLGLARDEADPSHLPLAERALNRSLELERGDNLEAFVGMASLANARHDFSRSMEWSRRAIETNPQNSAGYGLLGDSLFELGRVRAADAAYQKMVDVRPDVTSYVRASYALQYHGETRGGFQVMRLALEAAGPSGETAAWVRHQMGDIYAGLRRTREAARQNRIGMAIAPDYVPPTVGLAEAHIAAGRLEPAIEIMEQAVEGLPSLEYMITLGDLYEATDRDDAAQGQYREVAEKLKVYRDNGVRPDADFILFYADHGLRTRAALREAFLIYRDRPTEKTADALAWMLHQDGRDREAWRYAMEAIDGRGVDSTMLFHAGSIARSLGRDAAAVRLMREALRLDPRFSVIQGPIARQVASSR